MTQLIDEAKSKELIDNVDAFIFDCDGVLWDGSGAINGSQETVKKLKDLGKKVFFVTNNSSKSRQGYVDKCHEYGYPAEKEDVLCTAYVAAAYLKKLKFEGKVYLVGRLESIGAELDLAGISYTGPGPDPLVGDQDDWLKTEVDPETKCVLVGMDPHISYMKVMKAATYLRDPNCLFVATNTDPCLPTTKGNVTIPGTGTVVFPISYAAGRQPVIVGKPETHMFEILHKIHNLDPARCLMVGDSLNTDIKFAKRCGMRSLLVLTGVNSLQDISHNPYTQASHGESVDEVPNVPDLYAPSLADLGKYL